MRVSKIKQEVCHFHEEVLHHARVHNISPPFFARQVETAGDCYIVSGGIMSPSLSADGLGLAVKEGHNPAESAERVMAFAQAILVVAEQVRCLTLHF